MKKLIINIKRNITVDSDARRVAMPDAENPFEGPPFGEFFRFGQPAPLTHSMGSGFLISDDGYLLTNAYVVGEAKTVTVKLTDKREMEGKVVGRAPATDVVANDDSERARKVVRKMGLFLISALLLLTCLTWGAAVWSSFGERQ
ncbi:MAG: trypsin-like peptidase domain-containing protein [Nitrospirota bacterium]